MKYPPVHYHEYLDLDKLLNAQKCRSEQFGQLAHDELLFITVHQTYELWFKQIIFELDSILAVFSQESVADQEMGTAIHRMNRILDILKFSLGQIDILETMTPLDFLDFRDFLYPASGFQSAQFRLLEVKLGLREGDRMAYNQTVFTSHLPQSQQDQVKSTAKELSLFDGIDRWLARTPFLQIQDYDFWKTYQQAVLKMLAQDRETIMTNPRLDQAQRDRNIKMLEGSEKTFQSLFSEKDYAQLQSEGHFRMQLKALHAALFILVYRDVPQLQQPHRLLSCLIDIDEVLTTWRYRHAQMVLRMLGRKIGTGGSSGHDYLRDTAEKHRIFKDFSHLATFLIPRSQIPILPELVIKKMKAF